jgi:hypothetical protein
MSLKGPPIGLIIGIFPLDFYLIDDFFTLLEDLFARWLFKYSSLVFGSSPPGLSIICFNKLSADLTVANFFASPYN